MKHYLHSTDEVFSEVQSSAMGLSSADAQSRLEKYGKNKLQEAKKKSTLARFIDQLKDPMIIILIVAAVISAATGILEGIQSGAGMEFPTDVLIILFVVVLNSVLGVVQESKAEAAIEALQEMAAATSKVIRDGKLCSVKSEELVPGDIIHLEAGDSIPADARIIECAGMQIEEASLTGESVPVNKKVDTLTAGDNGDVPLGDRKNMVYMGSNVVYGRGVAVVTGTGMNTEMGKIAGAIAEAEEGQTPLQIKLAQLSKILSFLVIGICIFIFAFTLITSKEGFSVNLALDTFMVAISLAVAAIPEGLAAVVTILLSMGVTKMSKQNAIIRKLTAVETLGCAQIICSDKTGTLTQNKMTVVETYTADEELFATGMALCTDAEVEGESVIGEPTEAALVNHALKNSLNKNDLKAKYPRVAEVPFDSNRKMMTTVHQNSDGIIQFTKGAPDVVLDRCTYALVDGKEVPMTEEIRNNILTQNKAYADKALRVLALSSKSLSAVPTELTSEALEHDMVFTGLCGMIDPVRPEVKVAIEECRSAGITPIMITGDHKDTAVAIAKELGIIMDASEAITGAELDTISDEDFKEKVKLYHVYARVQPEHKVRIVNAWRDNGRVTAMTGDGVNDAPSIKSADIGVGMGITGTDVTKNVADMVLADDNFATIVAAVAQGRRIYDNIRKAIQFLLSSNLSEVLSIFTATMLGFTILKPTHLLWINLITDTFPALSLGMEKAEKDIMQRKPRSSKDGIFAGGLGADVFYQGAMVTVLTLAAYFLGNLLSVQELFAHGVISGDLMAQIQSYAMTFMAVESETIKHALEAIAVSGHGIYNNAYDLIHANGMTMAFLTMSMAEVFHSFNMRSQRKSVFTLGNHNKWLYGAMILTFLLTTAVIYVPFLANAFEFTAISGIEYGVSIALAVTTIPIVEFVKAIQRAIAKRKSK